MHTVSSTSQGEIPITPQLLTHQDIFYPAMTDFAKTKVQM